MRAPVLLLFSIFTFKQIGEAAGDIINLVLSRRIVGMATYSPKDSKCIRTTDYNNGSMIYAENKTTFAKLLTIGNFA